MTDPNTAEKQEQERQYAHVLWEAQKARNDLRAMAEAPGNIRRRSKRELIKLVLGIGGLVLACWYMGYVVYTFWH